MTDCPYLERVAAYDEEDLDSIAHQEMERHLRVCAACSRELAAQRSALEMLAGFEAPGWSEGLVADILGAVDALPQVATAAGEPDAGAAAEAGPPRVEREAPGLASLALNVAGVLILLSVVAWGGRAPAPLALEWTVPTWLVSTGNAVLSSLEGSLACLGIAARLACLVLPYVALYVGSALLLGLAFRLRTVPILQER